MAGVVKLLRHGGQLRAECELGWDRKAIIKGTKKEISSGIHVLTTFRDVAKTCRSASAQFVGRHKGHSQSGLSNRSHISHPGSNRP
jgi:hypothetical protein